MRSIIIIKNFNETSNINIKPEIFTYFILLDTLKYIVSIET